MVDHAVDGIGHRDCKHATRKLLHLHLICLLEEEMSPVLEWACFDGQLPPLDFRDKYLIGHHPISGFYEIYHIR